MPVSKVLAKNNRVNLDQTRFSHDQFKGIFRRSRVANFRVPYSAIYLKFSILTIFSNGEMYALLIEWLNKTPVGSPSRNHKRDMIISSILGNKV